MNQSGRCQCGNVNYYFDKEKVISAHHCHCKDCQRTTGCGKATILYIASKNIKVDGELKFFDSKGSSGMTCLLYTSPSPRDRTRSRMPSSA